MVVVNHSSVGEDLLRTGARMRTILEERVHFTRLLGTSLTHNVSPVHVLELRTTLHICHYAMCALAPVYQCTYARHDQLHASEGLLKVANDHVQPIRTDMFQFVALSSCARPLLICHN